MLTDEVKWLAITHKSFDHGKRGYNDRLAFLGMTFCSTRHREKLTRQLDRQENCRSTDLVGTAAQLVYKADSSDAGSIRAGTVPTPSAGGSRKYH